MLPGSSTRATVAGFQVGQLALAGHVTVRAPESRVAIGLIGEGNPTVNETKQGQGTIGLTLSASISLTQNSSSEGVIALSMGLSMEAQVIESNVTFQGVATIGVSGIVNPLAIPEIPETFYPSPSNRQGRVGKDRETMHVAPERGRMTVQRDGQPLVVRPDERDLDVEDEQDLQVERESRRLVVPKRKRRP